MKKTISKRVKVFLLLAMAVMLAMPITQKVYAASGPSTPSITSVSNTSSGVTVKWKKVSNATGYYIYRKAGSGSYSRIATVKKNSTIGYTDKSVKSGTTYTYKIKSYKSSKTSGYSKTKTVKRLSQPSPSVSNTSSGIKISWSKVTGASKYRIYYKSGSSWKTLADTSSTSYIDKKVKSGSSRTYTVKALSGSYASSYCSGKTIKRLSQPSPSVSNTSSGIKISWGKVTGASKYRIYYKSGSSWKKLADTSSTSYIDKSVKSGSSRTYTVKALSGSYASSYYSGKTMKRLSQPSFTLTNTATGVKISWSKVTGASSYQIYYKDGSSWKSLANTTATSYLDKNVSNGKAKTYTVKAISGSYASSYSSGKTITFRHDHSYTAKVIKEPTCTAAGAKTYTCACGDSYMEAIKATGHSYTSKVTTAATCEKNGVRTYTCSKCKDSYTETIKATGHNYTSKVTKEATCEEDGVRTYTCTKCEKSYTEAIKATGHDYTSKVTEKATCVESGLRTYTCSKCGKSYTETIPATGHHYTSVVTKEATAEENGVRTFTCDNCGDTYTEVIPATGHTYNSKVTKEATCTEDGVRTYTCSDCGKSYTETIPAIGHNYSSAVTKKATCTEDGVKTYTCANCKDTYTEAIPATGHSYTSKVTKAATCDEDGVRTYTCSACGDTYTESIPAIGHKWEDITTQKWVVDGKVWVVEQEAYDEEVQTGWNVYYECNGCGERFSNSGDASDHLFECPTPTGGYSACKDPIYETVHHDEVGHYEDTGHYETVVTGRKCTVCNKEELY